MWKPASKPSAPTAACSPAIFPPTRECVAMRCCGMRSRKSRAATRRLKGLPCFTIPQCLCIELGPSDDDDEDDGQPESRFLGPLYAVLGADGKSARAERSMNRG